MNYLKNCKVLIAMIACTSLTVTSCSDEIDEIPTDETTSENLTGEKSPVVVNYGEPTTYFYNKKEYDAAEWEAQQQIFKANKEVLFYIVLGEKAVAYDTSEEFKSTIETLRNMIQQTESKNVINDERSMSSNDNFESLYNVITRGTKYTPAKLVGGSAFLSLLFMNAPNLSFSEGGYWYLYESYLQYENYRIVRFNLPAHARNQVTSIQYNYYNAPRTGTLFNSPYPLLVRMRDDYNYGGIDYNTTLEEGDEFVKNDLSQNGWFGRDWSDRAESVEFCIGCVSLAPFNW